MKKFFNSAITFMIAALFLASCGPALKSNDHTLKVLTSTTFLADITRNIAGDRVKVDSLLPTGTDPHSYQPAPTDVAKITECNLLILNGLEYETFIKSLLDAQSADGRRVIVIATDGLTPHQMADEQNPSQMVGDPHMWLDPNLVVKYAENIRDGLIQIDPQGEGTYKSNTETYIAQLKSLDTWITEQVKTIPTERRLLVTNHEALGYFAERYGFEVAGSVIPSFSSSAAPSAKEMAGLIDKIKQLHAPAVFLDTADNNTLAKQIADETGVTVVDDLHLESLTEGAPAATYIDMMKYNVSRIVETLK